MPTSRSPLSIAEKQLALPVFVRSQLQIGRVRLMVLPQIPFDAAEQACTHQLAPRGTRPGAGIEFRGCRRASARSAPIAISVEWLGDMAHEAVSPPKRGSIVE